MRLRKQKTVVNIDQFFETNREFWQELEIFCVAECCGIDAFDFSVEAISGVASLYDTKTITKDLKRSIEFIEQSSSEKISSTILNYCVSKKEFAELLKNIKQVLLRVSV